MPSSMRFRCSEVPARNEVPPGGGRVLNRGAAGSAALAGGPPAPRQPGKLGHYPRGFPSARFDVVSSCRAWAERVDAGLSKIACSEASDCEVGSPPRRTSVTGRSLRKAQSYGRCRAPPARTIRWRLMTRASETLALRLDPLSPSIRQLLGKGHVLASREALLERRDQ